MPATGRREATNDGDEPCGRGRVWAACDSGSTLLALNGNSSLSLFERPSLWAISQSHTTTGAPQMSSYHILRVCLCACVCARSLCHCFSLSAPCVSLFLLTSPSVFLLQRLPTPALNAPPFHTCCHCEDHMWVLAWYEEHNVYVLSEKSTVFDEIATATALGQTRALSNWK